MPIQFPNDNEHSIPENKMRLEIEKLQWEIVGLKKEQCRSIMKSLLAILVPILLALGTFLILITSKFFEVSTKELHVSTMMLSMQKDELSKSIDSFKVEKIVLKRTSDSLTTSNDSLKTANKRSSSQRNNLRRLLSKMQQIINSTTSQNKNLNIEKADFDKKIKQAQMDLAGYETNIHDQVDFAHVAAEQQRETLQAHIDDLNDTIFRLHNELNKVKAANK